jgi:hypothetical protein
MTRGKDNFLQSRLGQLIVKKRAIRERDCSYHRLDIFCHSDG